MHCDFEDRHLLGYSRLLFFDLTEGVVFMLPRKDRFDTVVGSHSNNHLSSNIVSFELLIGLIL